MTFPRHMLSPFPVQGATWWRARGGPLYRAFAKASDSFLSALSTEIAIDEVERLRHTLARFTPAAPDFSGH